MLSLTYIEWIGKDFSTWRFVSSVSLVGGFSCFLLDDAIRLPSSSSTSSDGNICSMSKECSIKTQYRSCVQWSGVWKKKNYGGAHIGRSVVKSVLGQRNILRCIQVPVLQPLGFCRISWHPFLLHTNDNSPYILLLWVLDESVQVLAASLPNHLPANAPRETANAALWFKIMKKFLSTLEH